MIAYDLEKNLLSKEIIQAVKMKFKYIFDMRDDFIDSISVTDYGMINHHDVTLMMAYKMYHYSFEKYNYTKSGNSLGKLLIFDVVSYKKDREKSIELAKEFLTNEMHRGNIHSISNLAVYYYNNPKESPYTEKELKRLLSVSASFGDVEGNYYLGKMLFGEGKYEEGLKYLNYAASLNDGDSYLLLGNYFELKGNNAEAIECYKKAIINHCHDGAYYLALLYYNYYKEENNQLYIELSKDYIDKYYDLFSEEIQKKADLLKNNK